MTSIFIKTFPKDHVWLQYLLPSIEKYANGFKDVIIVSDAGTEIPPAYLSSIKKIPVRTHYIPVPTPTSEYPKIENEVGYLWQQYIKLNWFKLCDSDSVMVLDSDEMLCKPLTPDQLKHDGKWIWTYRSWNEAEDAQFWKQSTDFILGKNTPHEAMCVTGFVLTKPATINLLNYICETHSISNFWELVTKKRMGKFSEYNIYGSFIHMINHPEYYYNIKKDIPLHNSIIKKWSWGGITQEIHKNAMAHLH
jgi:hypothetical protein